MVPFQLVAGRGADVHASGARATRPSDAGHDRADLPTGDRPPVPGAVPIGDVRWRRSARIHGRIRSLRVQPWADVATLECVVVDETGGLLLVFLGRRQVAGIELGRHARRRGHGRRARGATSPCSTPRSSSSRN